MIDNSETAVGACFDEIYAMAQEERKLHPGYLHYQTVDAALEALRVNVKSYLTAAGSALTLGNTAEAEHLRAQAAIVVAQARPVWTARLEAAKAERERVHCGIEAAQRGSMMQMMGVYPPGRGVEVKDADRGFRRRLDAILPSLTEGDEGAFNAVLDDIGAALADYRSALGVSRRESRLRVAAAHAQAAVSAVSAIKSADGDEAAA